MGLTKRKLVRALVDVWARAVGCLRMMGQDEDGDEKRMHQENPVRQNWLNYSKLRKFATIDNSLLLSENIDM